MGRHLLAVIADSVVETCEIEEEVFGAAGVELRQARWRGREELAAQLKEADAILCVDAPLDAEMIGSLRHCKVISRYGTGLNNIDLEAAARAGIAVRNIVGWCSEEVATHTLALILAWNRRLVQCDAIMKAGGWAELKELGTIHTLHGKTLGIVGLGAIGQEVAAKARAFGMKVLAYHPRLSPTEVAQRGAELVSFDNLLASSDFVTMHAPLNQETRHLFGEREFRLMKKTAVFVNTSRGAIADEDALARALERGEIAGALLDVYSVKPPPADSPLRRLRNVLLTPHIAYYSEESVATLRRRAAENAVEVLAQAGGVLSMKGVGDR